MAKRSIRAARLLAAHTQEVSRHTAPAGEHFTVMDLIERQLARRAEHAAAIAVIDGELTRVYERLAADVPVGVKPSPSPMSSLQAAELAGTPAVARTATAPAAPTVQTPVQARTTRVKHVGVTVVDAIVAAVRGGNQTPAGLKASLEAAGHLPWQVKSGLAQCLRQGLLIASGHTQSRRYELAPEHVARPAVTPASGRRAIVDDGVEFEPVWTGAKTDPSLLGDRTTRGHVLA